MPGDDIVMLALEVEALAEADANDDALDAEVLAAVGCAVPGPLAGGVVLAHLGRASQLTIKVFLAALEASPTAYEALIEGMLAVDSRAAVRVLGAAAFVPILQRRHDQPFHARVAEGLCAIVVPGSDLCLPHLKGDAQVRLAATLAERSGMAGDIAPTWLAELPLLVVDAARLSLAVGTLMASRGDDFAAIAGGLSTDERAKLAEHVRRRAPDIPSSGIAEFLRHMPAPPRQQKSEASVACASTSTRDSPAILMGTVAHATSARELDDIWSRADALASPTWKQEIFRAVARRRLALGLGPGRTQAAFPRQEKAIAAALARLDRGDWRPLGRLTWQRIPLERRFATLADLIARREDHGRCPDAAGVGALANAIAALPPAMRAILSFRLIDAFGANGDIPAGAFDPLLKLGSDAQPETHAALARALAMRGDRDGASRAVVRAQSIADRQHARDDLDRFERLLEQRDHLPVSVLSAVKSAIATIGDAQLPDAVDLCRQKLPSPEWECVVGSLIAAGRARAALSHLLAA